MKVKDLILKLQECNPDADVILYSSTSEDADTWGGNVEPYANPQEAGHYTKGATISEICQKKTDEIVKSWEGRDGKVRHQYKYVNSEDPIVVIS